MFPSFSSFEKGNDEKRESRRSRHSDRSRKRHRDSIRRPSDQEHHAKRRPTEIIDNDLYFFDGTGDRSLMELKQPYRRELPQYYRACNFVIGDDLRIIPSKEDFERFQVSLCRVEVTERKPSSNTPTDTAYYLKYHNCPRTCLPFYFLTEKNPHTPKEFVSIDTPSSTDDLLKDLLAKRIQIQRDLDVFPTAQKWYEMATTQEVIASLGSNSKRLRQDQKLQTRLSVYEAALKTLPDDPEIMLRYMDCLEGVSSLTSEINHKWKSFTATTGDPRIWERRVDALLLDRQSNFTAIYLELKCVFEDIDKRRSFVKMDEVYHACLRRVFTIWDGMGYSTWTTSLIQALLEQAFFFSVDETLEQFWNSRQPRLGDPHSKGWRYSTGGVRQSQGRTPFDEVLFEDISPFIQSSSDKLDLLWACLLHMGLIIPGNTLPKSLEFESSENELVGSPNVPSQAILMCELIFREVETDQSFQAFTSWWGDSDYTEGSLHPIFSTGKKMLTMAERGLAFDPRIFKMMEQFLDTEPGWNMFLAYGKVAGLDCNYILSEAVCRLQMSFPWWKKYILSVEEKQEPSLRALSQLPWCRDLHVWLICCDWITSEHKAHIKNTIMEREMNVTLDTVTSM